MSTTEGTAPRRAPAPAEFPADSFREAARSLRRPFTAEAVKFKVQAVWPKAEPANALVVGYIDARLVVERLNLVCPHLWEDGHGYEPLGRDHLICRLTVDGITRTDVGQGAGKGAYSDALKRAAVKFGVGVSLYAIPKMVLALKDGHVKRKGDSLELTTKGEGHLRTMYSGWLDAHGREAFGDPLNHGDVADAQGDPDEATPEAEMPASEGVAQAVEPEQKPAPALSPDEVKALLKLAKQAISEDGPWTKELLLRHLVGAGATDTTSVRHGVLTLSSEQAVEFERTVTQALEAHEDAREQVAAQAEAQVDTDDARAEAS